MKKIFRIFAAALLGTSMMACSNFLDEKVTTSYDGDVMVSTESALEAAILGCHYYFADAGFKEGTFCEWLSPASGLSHWTNGSALTDPSEKWSCQLKFTRFSKQEASYNSFRSFYRAIYRCNSLIEALGSSPVDESYKKEIEGEAYFLRAMSYFYLVRCYGDVTLFTDAPKTKDEAYGPRDNFWEVYNQIVEDLGKAFSQMRSFKRMVDVAGGNSSGRVCNYTAKACRSLVYLTIGTLLAHPDDNFWLAEKRTPDFSQSGIKSAEDAFRLALADAEDVINNGPFELCQDYRQLFRWTEPDDWQLKERIWCLPRSPEASGGGSGLTMWALPNYYMGTSTVGNFGRCRPCRWFFQKWCETFDGKKGTGANNSNIYVDCDDPRLKVNIAYNSMIGGNSTGKPVNVYPADNRIYSGDLTMTKSYGVPYYIKYYDPTYDNSTGNSDFYVMRYAEVYLIAAEAYANLCSDPSDANGKKAIEYLNIIRERARKSVDEGKADAAEPHALSSDEFEVKEQLISAIFWDRMFEMPFEHHDYFDTHRMGAKWLTDNIAKPKNDFLEAPEQQDYTKDNAQYSGYRTLFFGKGFQYDEDWTLVRKGLISAYPNDELVYNPFLDVNRNDPNTGQNPVEVFWK